MAVVTDAYLDIETTGLSPSGSKITVVGLYLSDAAGGSLVQLVGDEVTESSILEAIGNASNIFTYNGSRFDLPFIRACTGVDLCRSHQHHDLMFDCWGRGLYGGFKAVEQRLGIERKLKGIDGLEAVRLWWRYENDGDEKALRRLLKYNAEDVINLKTLRERLGSKA
ncbi:MAG: ribonuclease H-like domain-containing protein [Chloroflexi bacterium]|nr:ribonuclease H-like domain-containing protein [Chloroflexota bacterium]